MWCWMWVGVFVDDDFFFARPTLSVRTRKQLQSRKVARYWSLGRCPGFSCGSHIPNRLLGPYDDDDDDDGNGNGISWRSQGNDQAD